MNQKLFITGIPTAGKSHLAKKIADTVGGVVVSIDDHREKFRSNPDYAPWIDFYVNQDERAYYAITDYKKGWEDLVRQSEGLWPAILEVIHRFDDETKPVIFEGVNILPHLAKKDLNFPGIVLLGESFEKTFERNKKDPRWGKTEELQLLEAKDFFYGERPRYRQEAEEYGYRTFTTPDEAWSYVLATVTAEDFST